MARLSLNEQAEQILKIAEGYNVDKNFFFITTFKRYLVQINILNELENSIKADGILVTKEYVKNRKNVYTHPAIQDYNRTTDSANKTVSTIMKIIKSFAGEDLDNTEDPLLKIINGGDSDESD